LPTRSWNPRLGGIDPGGAVADAMLKRNGEPPRGSRLGAAGWKRWKSDA
jgi:hypothetical protein